MLANCFVHYRRLQTTAVCDIHIDRLVQSRAIGRIISDCNRSADERMNEKKKKCISRSTLPNLLGSSLVALRYRQSFNTASSVSAAYDKESKRTWLDQMTLTFPAIHKIGMNTVLRMRLVPQCPRDCRDNRTYTRGITIAEYPCDFIIPIIREIIDCEHCLKLHGDELFRKVLKFMLASVKFLGR